MHLFLNACIEKIVIIHTLVSYSQLVRTALSLLKGRQVIVDRLGSYPLSVSHNRPLQTFCLHALTGSIEVVLRFVQGAGSLAI